LVVIAYQEIPTDLLMEPVAVIRPDDLSSNSSSAVASLFETGRPA
jgi:flagellar biosynthesis protein FlhA